MPRNEGESGRCFDDIYANLQKHGLVIQPPIRPRIPLIASRMLATSAMINDGARDMAIIIMSHLKQWWIAQSLHPPCIAVVKLLTILDT